MSEYVIRCIENQDIGLEYGINLFLKGYANNLTLLLTKSIVFAAIKFIEARQDGRLIVNTVKTVYKSERRVFSRKQTTTFRMIDTAI